MMTAPTDWKLFQTTGVAASLIIIIIKPRKSKLGSENASVVQLTWYGKRKAIRTITCQTNWYITLQFKV